MRSSSGWCMRTDLNCSSVRHLCPSPSLFCQAIFSGVFTDLLPPHNFDRYVAAADAYVVASGSLLFGRRSGSMALAKGQSLAELIAAGAPAPRRGWYHGGSMFGPWRKVCLEQVPASVAERIMKDLACKLCLLLTLPAYSRRS